jgi:Cu/Ag efflux protein CusF
MRMLTCAAAAAALLGATSVAFAADATGKITNVDTSKDMITLDNGSSYVAPKGMKLSDFKVGEKVTVSFTKAGDRMDATSIKPAT